MVSDIPAGDGKIVNIILQFKAHRFISTVLLCILAYHKRSRIMKDIKSNRQNAKYGGGEKISLRKKSWESSNTVKKGSRVSHLQQGCY